MAGTHAIECVCPDQFAAITASGRDAVLGAGPQHNAGGAADFPGSNLIYRFITTKFTVTAMRSRLKM